MSTPEKIEGLDRLVSDPGRRLVNIKFFRRSDVAISASEFKTELCASIKRRDGKHAIRSNRPPVCKSKNPIDVRSFVADM